MTLRWKVPRMDVENYDAYDQKCVLFEETCWVCHYRRSRRFRNPTQVDVGVKKGQRRSGWLVLLGHPLLVYHPFLGRGIVFFFHHILLLLLFSFQYIDRYPSTWTNFPLTCAFTLMPCTIEPGHSHTETLAYRYPLLCRTCQAAFRIAS